MIRRRGWRRLTLKGPDFRTRKGAVVELKTDFRALETGRIFVERWGNAERKKHGGPYRSYRENCDYFSTLLWDSNGRTGVQLISFKPKNLISHIKSLGYSEEDLLSVPNKSYTTKGWAIPIGKLKESPNCIVEKP